MQSVKHRQFVMKISFCLFALFLLGFHPPAQAQIKKGEKLMQQGAYTEAIKPLKKDFYSKDRNIAAGILLAKCYYQLREYQEAADVMSQISRRELTNPEDLRVVADIHIANGNFTDAYLEIIQLLSEDQGDAKTYLWLDKISNLLEWDSLDNGTTVNTVKGINSIYNDYAPYIAKSGELWFVSDMMGIQSIFPTSYDNRNLHLYYKTKPKKNDITIVNTPGMLLRGRDYYYHDGPITEWKKENKLVFTLREIDAINGKIGLYFSDPSGKEESLIPFKYNENYNTGHATFNNDGTRMIFSSDREGGYGQMDLWYCDWVDGNWTEPVNLGPIINTPFNEVFPGYNSDHIFFSSDRSDIGYGALDIYYTSERRGFNKIYNLRAPINGPYDDFAITFLNNKEGYFSSNRKQGVGGDDIYAFTREIAKVKLDESHFEFANVDVPKDTKFEIYNSRDSLVATVTDIENNAFTVSNLESGERYSMKTENAHISKNATLNLHTASGKNLATYSQSANKSYEFELMSPMEWLETEKSTKKSNTLMHIVRGQIIADKGVAVDGVPVSLKTTDGVVLSKSKTTADGRFTIDNVAMDEKYTIETENVNGYHEIDIYGASGAITQSIVPTGKNRFSYIRAAAPAMWMETTEISVPDVIAIIPNLHLETKDHIVMYDDMDNELIEPRVDRDEFMSLGTLRTGKAYRLHLPDKNLKRDDRLVIISASGDTSQTVRPFDDKNYFFEYLIYKDYGQAEPENELELTDVTFVNTFGSIKIEIKNFDLSENTAFVLQSINREYVDTLYCDKNGVIHINHLNTNMDYELELMHEHFSEDKKIEVFNSNNSLIYTGTSTEKSKFKLLFLDIEDHTLSELENEDLSVLKLNFTGRISSHEAVPKEITVSDNKGLMLGRAYATASGEFSITDIKPGLSYLVSTNIKDPDAMLIVKMPGSPDSLRLQRNKDGNFYVTLNDVTQKDITLVDANKNEVSVKEGSRFSLSNVYYGFNSYYLKLESRKSIDKLIKLLKDNPELRVEIQSHTDSRGPANYNNLLSQRRADAVVKYITDAGIKESQLVAIGKGENELANKCKDGVTCTDEEHAANRRTEFIILGKTDKP